MKASAESERAYEIWRARIKRGRRERRLHSKDKQNVIKQTIKDAILERGGMWSLYQPEDWNYAYEKVVKQPGIYTTKPGGRLLKKGKPINIKAPRIK